MTDAAAPLAVDAHGGWPGVLGILTAGEDLTGSQAGAVMADILAGRATDAQIAGCIVGLRQKGETVEEMTAMARSMLDAAEPLTVPGGAIDIVGTGGSSQRRAHALNVSTMASIVAASAGAIVCKHGNYKASSTSGSFDFLSALGVTVDLTPSQLESVVAETNLGFALARTFHPAMRHAGPVRAQLGIPTVFNVLGPLAHPGRLRRQLVGTPDETMGARMASVLQGLGSERSWVVTGAGGLDELSTTGPSVVFDVTPNGVERLEIDLRFLGITPPTEPDALAGGTAEQNVAIFRSILDGAELGPRADIISLNAGAGLVVADVAPDLATGIRLAREAMADGRTTATLEQIIEVTGRFASA